MRVTLNHVYTNSIRNVQNRSSDYQRASQIASTGKQVDSPAADPGGYSQVLDARSRLSGLESFMRNLQFAISEVNFADSALQTVQTTLSQVVERASAGVSETLNADERAGFGAEIRALSETIRRAANSEFNGRKTFGGGISTEEAFDANGVYQGGDQPPQILAGEDYVLTTGMTGDEIFGAAGGVDIFALLDDIATALETDNPSAAHARLDELGASINQISTARAFYGAVTNHSEALVDLYSATTVRETEALSMVEDADMAAAFSDLSRLNTVFEATLQASAQVAKRTLFDYL